MYYDRDGQPISQDEWIERWGRGIDYRQVARTTVDESDVSTVWLGLDHGFGRGRPLIFETMVFGGPLSDECWRYSTECEALAGHAKMVERLRDNAP